MKLSCTPVRKFSLKPQYANELFVISSSSQLDGHESAMNVKFCSVETNICSVKIKTEERTTIINPFLVNKRAEIIVLISISPATLECPSVPLHWNVRQSHVTGMSVSPMSLECLSVPRLGNVLQFHDSGMSVSSMTQECLSVPQIRKVHQFRNSGISVSPETMECPPVPLLWNVQQSRNS